jgi:2-dehydro-3-deoxygluconokinase
MLSFVLQPMNKQTLHNSNSGSVLCFGELLLRLSPDAGGDWLAQNRVPIFMGGAELNVATALALWHVPVRYYTALPDNYLTDEIISHVNSLGIDAGDIYRHGDRMGIYYLAKGADLKNDSLIYDRAGSAFAGLKPGMIDWDKVFTDVSWFHLTAICPALNQNVADVCEEALIAASKKGITTSIDLNYRAKLWKYGKAPHEVMPALVEHCDVVMGNIWASEMMLDIPIAGGIHEKGLKDNYLQAAIGTSEYIAEKYPKCKAVANTFRFDKGDRTNYYTALYTSGKHYHTEDHTAGKIVNKVGSGDCFMAGLIYGFYNGHSPEETLQFATRAAFDKLFIAGDATKHTVEEIKNSHIAR